MANFNKVILMGNLTRDPESKALPSGTTVTEFGLAVNRKWKSKDGEQKEETCFVECTAFGRTGEVINQYMQKGRPILVEGRLTFQQWEDKNGGGKRSKLKVTVDQFQFIGGREDASSGGPTASGNPFEPPLPPGVGDDIPF